MKNFFTLLLGFVLGIAVATYSYKEQASEPTSTTEMTSVAETTSTNSVAKTTTPIAATKPATSPKTAKTAQTTKSTKPTKTAKPKKITKESTLQLIKGATLFDSPTEIVTTNALKIIEVLKPGWAIAIEQVPLGPAELNMAKNGIEVILYEKGRQDFYDGMVVKVPQGKGFRQVGIYTTLSATLPIVIRSDL